MINSVGIIAKSRLNAAAGHLLDIARWMDARGIEPVFEKHTADIAGLADTRRHVSRDELPALADMILVLGGDGTLISMAVRVGMANREVPILGVNFGGLGFLTEITLDELYPSLESAIAGTAPIEVRSMLRARAVRDGEVFLDRLVLNDVSVTRGALSRIIDFSVSVGGEFVARFNADGLIIASPTGSTAYNLSSGGPIVHPAVDAIVLTPIAAHILTNRPVVIPGSAEVVVQPLHGGGTKAYATFDGQLGIPLQPSDEVRVSGASCSVHLVRPSGRGYFEVLRRKLGWAERYVKGGPG
jgi:NAD+ kinase